MSLRETRVFSTRRDCAVAWLAISEGLLSQGLGTQRGGIAPLISGPAVVVVAFGASSREAVARLDAALQQDFAELLASRRRHDATRLESAAPLGAAPEGLGAPYRPAVVRPRPLDDSGAGGGMPAP